MTSVVGWAKGIRDHEVHHIGEYYSDRYGKRYKRKNTGELNKDFIRWWHQQNSNAIEQLLEKEFVITYENEPRVGFSIRRKP